MSRDARDTLRPAGFWLRQCQCGSCFTHDEWARLALAGEMDGPEEGQRIELRHCPCGSTISVLLEEDT
jgi:hypothetical protein